MEVVRRQTGLDQSDCRLGGSVSYLTFEISHFSNLETVKTKRGVELLNCDDHQKIINKMAKKLEDYRPDVTH